MNVAPSRGRVVGDVAKFGITDLDALRHFELLARLYSSVFGGAVPHTVEGALHFSDDRSLDAGIGVAPAFHSIGDAYAAGIADASVYDKRPTVVTEL